MGEKGLGSTERETETDELESNKDREGRAGEVREKKMNCQLVRQET